MSPLSRNRIGMHLTLRERIADEIRDSIIKGDLRPGERISEPELAVRFGISRTPVREALRQLDSEGFLTVTPRKGARVTQLTERDVNEYYDLKSLLEGFAASTAALKISEEDLERMDALNERMEHYYEIGDYVKIVKVHKEFHDMIIEATENEQLKQVLNFMNSKFQRFTIQIALSGKNQEAFRQHRQIVDAMRARDLESAKRLVKANAMLGKELMIQEVQSEEFPC